MEPVWSWQLYSGTVGSQRQGIAAGAASSTLTGARASTPRHHCTPQADYRHLGWDLAQCLLRLMVWAHGVSGGSMVGIGHLVIYTQFSIHIHCWLYSHVT